MEVHVSPKDVPLKFVDQIVCVYSANCMASWHPLSNNHHNDFFWCGPKMFSFISVNFACCVHQLSTYTGIHVGFEKHVSNWYVVSKDLANPYMCEL